jgi:DNA phosphorothioation-dependent restriction protein DptG
MERIEFYKMSIEEYPNHKDKDSLIFCINELQNEVDSIYRYINHLEDNEGDEEIVRQLIKEHDELFTIVQLARTYMNNPKNCKGCINFTVTVFGERCTYLKTCVNSPNDMYKHPKCPVK